MTYTFELTEEAANLILVALASMPYGQVFQLIQTLQQQAAQQRRAREELSDG